MGSDQIIKNKDGKPTNYNLRFHLYPGLTAVKTISGNSVLIQLSRNKSLIFTINNESILIEKSIFLGGNKILDSVCVSISGNLVNKNKIIHWEIKKRILSKITSIELNFFYRCEGNKLLCDNLLVILKKPTITRVEKGFKLTNCKCNEKKK